MNNRLRDIIGVVLVASFIGIIFMLLYKAIPKDNEQLIVYMLGQLSGFVAGVVAFHYVTKAGEKELEHQRADNTGKAIDAIREAQRAPASGERAADAAERVAEAAESEAEAIRTAATPAGPTP